MKSFTIKITDNAYKHANMLSKIAAAAGGFTCDVWAIVGSEKANAKSLISLMSTVGSAKLPFKLEIRAEHWDDEQEAVDAIAKLFGK